MKSSDHTPGPWETNGITVRSSGPSRRQIALVEIAVRDCPYVERYDEAVAYARLIAAAPDLLAVCEEFVRKVETGEAKSKRSYAQMQAAIAKATI
jgi:hypothetical protein